MLPAPRTIATSVPSSRSRLIWSAMRPRVSGSVPKSSGPIRASPDSFSRTLEKSGANLEPGEALDDDVLAGLRRELGAQLLDRLAAVLVRVDVLLLEQDDLLEPLVDLALGGALARVLGNVVQLARGDAQLLGTGVLGDVLLVDVQRLRGGDVQGDVAGEGHEILVARDEVGVAVDLDERADLAVGVDVGLDRALCGLAAGQLGGAGDALLAQPGDRGVDVAGGLGQGLLAIHHPRARQVAQGLDVLRRDVGHLSSSVVACSSAAVLGSAAGAPSAGAAPLPVSCSSFAAPVVC